MVTGPTTEPVTTVETKAYLRVDTSDSDVLIGDLISAARMEAEAVAARSFISRTYELILDGWPADGRIELEYPPVASVTTIKYYDGDNVLQTMSSGDYVLVSDTTPPYITLASGASWPSDLRDHTPIRVRYVAGYGAASTDVPDNYRALIMGLVACEFEARDEETLGNVRRRERIMQALAMDWGWASSQ